VLLNIIKDLLLTNWCTSELS